MRSEGPKEQQAFYGSTVWKRCRAEYRKKVGGLCERCLSKGITEPGYIVHHKIHVNLDNINDPSILLNPENLELLCQRCHNEEHNKKAKRYYIAEDGRVYT